MYLFNNCFVCYVNYGNLVVVVLVNLLFKKQQFTHGIGYSLICTCIVTHPESNLGGWKGHMDDPIIYFWPRISTE